MPVYPELGTSLSYITVLVIQSNEILPGVMKKREMEDKDIVVLYSKPRVKIDGYFYPTLTHGPAKHYRPLITGKEGYLIASSAQTATELLLKYIRQLEPPPENYYPDEKQLQLFPAELLPEIIAA